MLIRVTREFPRCQNPGCAQPLPPEIIELLETMATSLACPACGTSTPARGVPDWFHGVHATGRFLVGERFAGADFSHQQQQTESVPFHCYHCGGSLTVDGSSRQVSCTYCGNTSMLPDEIWARLHPVAQVEPWYVLLDVGSGVGVLPQRVFSVSDVTALRDGSLVVAYMHFGSGGYCVARADAQGLITWLCDEIDFQDDPRLFTAPGDDTVIAVDTNANYLYYLDGATGRVTGSLPTEALLGDDMSLGHSAFFAPDHDQTLVIKRKWSQDGYRFKLRRFDRQGNRVKLWPGLNVNPLKRFFATFSRKSSKPVALEWDVQVTVGWDGNLYMLSSESKLLTWCDREGNQLGSVSLKLPEVDRIEDLGISESGTVYVAFWHAREVAGDQFVHILRLAPGAPPEVWMGPFSRSNRAYIGTGTVHLGVAPSGLLHLSGLEINELRTIDLDGQQIWRNGVTERADAEAERKLKKTLKKQKKLQG